MRISDWSSDVCSSDLGNRKLGMSESTLCQMDRSSPRERRQSAILDAAESLFLEQGYERTSLAEIVKRSGGSLATLYELFVNKQGLLRAIATRWCDEVKIGRAHV